MDVQAIFTNEAIQEVTQTIWSSVLMMDVAPSPETTELDGKEVCFTASVQISGDWGGAVFVECPMPLARRAAATMFEMEPDETGSEEIQDAIGEIANMTGGNIKSLIPGSCSLSTPTVTEGTDYKVRLPGYKIVKEIFFECESMPFKVTVLSKS